MYKILPYSERKAIELGVHIEPSKNPKKKIDVFDYHNNYICSIGAIGYKDYPTYVKDNGMEYAIERRRLYRIRHNKERDNINWEGSPSYYSWYLLW
jgi:hypothetical protein